MSGVETVTIGVDEAEQRLDRWLRKRVPTLTQGAIEKMCRKGELRVDGGRVKSAHRLAAGQAVRIPPLGASAQPRPDAPRPAAPRPAAAAADAEMIRHAVIWKDQHIIALNKPPGLPSQGGSGQGGRHVDGLADALMYDYKERPKLVHRLDKDTSGILLLARTDRVARRLAEAFRHRATRKIYWAAVAGSPHPRAGTIRLSLVKAGGAAEKMLAVPPDRVDETEGARRATTDYRVIEALGPRAAWVALAPITGRTHQLRAHMAAIGHPILGDGKYGTSSQENLGDGWGAGIGGEISRKLHLHARTLMLEHPVTKAMLTLTAPLPDHMARTWDFVGWDVRQAPLDPFAPAE